MQTIVFSLEIEAVMMNHLYARKIKYKGYTYI